MRDTDGVTAGLIEEFTDWLDDRDVPDPAAFAAHAETFLNWREPAPLNILDDGDLSEFLLRWCPRQLSVPAEDSWEVCEAVGEFVFFLGCTGRLRGGVDRARQMMRTAINLTDTMTARMGDPANFGMAKSLFAGITGAESMTREELAAAMQRRVDEHNALPLEQRRAATDRFFAPPPPIELPFLYVPPTETEVAAAVDRAALPAQISALRDYLGENGRALTATGNLKLADGRALVDLLDTGDEIDPTFGSKTFSTRSTASLPGLAYLVELAIAAGAVRRWNKRLVPVKAWAKKSTLERATVLFRTAVGAGVLSWNDAGWAFYSDVHRMLDEAVVPWLAGLLAPGARADLDDIIELNSRLVAAQFTGSSADYYLSGHPLARDIGRIMEVLAMTGALDWSGYQETVTVFDDRYRTGGTIALTALGRHVLPDLLPQAGLSLRTATNLSGADLTELLATMSHAAPEQHPAMLASWQPSRPVTERAADIAAMITEAPDAHTRLIGLRLLGMFDTEVAEPFMRQLLDTAAAGHSAVWLLEHGLADGDAVGQFITPAMMVDILSELIEHPEVLCEQFLAAHDPELMLEFFWRHDAPETPAVLDALGRHLPDRALAKQARKAAMRHRSWIANHGV